VNFRRRELVAPDQRSAEPRAVTAAIARFRCCVEPPSPRPEPVTPAELSNSCLAGRRKHCESRISLGRTIQPTALGPEGKRRRTPRVQLQRERGRLEADRGVEKKAGERFCLLHEPRHERERGVGDLTPALSMTSPCPRLGISMISVTARCASASCRRRSRSPGGGVVLLAGNDQQRSRSGFLLSTLASVGGSGWPSPPGRAAQPEAARRRFVQLLGLILADGLANP